MYLRGLFAEPEAHPRNVANCSTRVKTTKVSENVYRLRVVTEC
jgi:hypothetical protein